MKLLHCDPLKGGCGDLVRLYSLTRSCHCGKSRGRYNSDAFAILSGPCRVIGLDTGEVVRAMPQGTWTESSRCSRVDLVTDYKDDYPVARFESYPPVLASRDAAQDAAEEADLEALNSLLAGTGTEAQTKHKKAILKLFDDIMESVLGKQKSP